MLVDFLTGCDVIDNEEGEFGLDSLALILLVMEGGPVYLEGDTMAACPFFTGDAGVNWRPGPSVIGISGSRVALVIT